MNTCKLCGGKRMIEVSVFETKKIKSYYNFDVSHFFIEDTFYLYKCLDCEIKTYDKVIPGDADYYINLQKNPFYYEEYKKEFDYAIKKISLLKPKKVLEIGCGKGFFIKKIMPVVSIKGSELGEKNIQFLQNQKIDRDTLEDTYDFICSFQVFEHINDIKEMLYFCNKKLIKGGHLLISVPHNESPIFQEMFHPLDHPPHHMHQFNKTALENIGKILHYEVVEYWEDPIKIEHLHSLMQNRREKMLHFIRLNKSVLKPIIKKIYKILDVFFMPYFYDQTKCKGDRHAMLYKKI